MTFELARALLNAEAIAPVPLAKALFTVATEGVPLPRALVALGIMTEERLEEELARVDVPKVQSVVGVSELMELLPAGLCSRLLALPIRKDPRTGTVDLTTEAQACGMEHAILQRSGRTTEAERLVPRLARLGRMSGAALVRRQNARALGEEAASTVRPPVGRRPCNASPARRPKARATVASSSSQGSAASKECEGRVSSSTAPSRPPAKVVASIGAMPTPRTGRSPAR